ncbi:uncharacterized protein LOC144287740 isoform X2 [Canis aureus]
MLLLKYSSSTSSPDSASLEPYSQITGRLSHPASPSRSPKVSTSAGNCMYPTISSPQDEKFFLCPWMKIQSVSCLSSMTLVWTVPSFVNFWQSKYQVLRRKNKQGSTGDPTLLILTGFWFTLGTRFE